MRFTCRSLGPRQRVCQVPPPSVAARFVRASAQARPQTRNIHER
jgi:hypothetical protein